MLQKGEVARDLYRKIHELFPEFKPFVLEGDEENSTMALLDLIDSLEQADASPENADVMERLDCFRAWVEDYPRGDDASNDIFTYYHVTFVEGILEHETLYRLAPAIIAKKSLIQGKDYFYTWIGPTEYHRALTAFPEEEAS
jgi:hypothetical protein